MSISSQGKRTRRICVNAMLCAVAMLLSYLEALLPLQVLPIPGFRLGLANVAVVAVFCLLSPLDAAIVSSVRIVLMGLLFGTVTSFYFSLLGGVFSFLMLILLRAVGRRCSYVGVSVLCAAAHNTGQICAAVTLFGAALIPSYLPLLLFASVIYGGVIGLLLNLLLPRLQPHVCRLLGNALEGVK
ncbi:MAG: Gx transporter family protein [Clostridia bacterium]|nr:Gx transporter family protein [Clostridia bacterium]